jgi:hypothetical protein
MGVYKVNDHAVIREMGKDKREETAFWRMRFYCIWWSGLDSLRLMIPPAAGCVVSSHYRQGGLS